MARAISGDKPWMFFNILIASACIISCGELRLSYLFRATVHEMRLQCKELGNYNRKLILCPPQKYVETQPLF